MKESTIDALLQLFALIANVRDGRISERAMDILRRNLEKVISRENIDTYLAKFHGYLVEYHKVSIHESADAGKLKKRSAQSVKALLICERNNANLQQYEKVRILSRLIELSNEDGIITSKEDEFLNVVKDTFNINNEEYQDIRAMILRPWIQGVRKDKLVFIDQSKFIDRSIKHLTWKGIEGLFIALYIESCNLYMIKYIGNEVYYRNSQIILPNTIEFLDTDSLITGVRISPIYYSTITARFFQDQIKRDLEYVAQDVEYKFWNSINGVQDFSFSAKSGDLIGIMGGSGVGKSTLLNVLNGNLKPQQGSMYINGYDIQRFAKELEGMIGYIPQDDLLIDDLTVFQNLYYNARLCFRDFSEMHILKSVVRVLKDLDLYEIKHLKVGNPREKFISGGQRKRLNIGLELLRQPMILFVDEPTSGLSSMDAESVMHLLNRQAIQGKIVVINIHQPSSDIYKLFTKVLVMDKGGYLIYQGDPLSALVYFKTENEQLNAEESQCPTCGNVNPEQVLEIVETKYVNEYGRFTGIRRFSPKQWNEQYRKKIENTLNFKVNRLRIPNINFRIPNQWHQFLIFAARDLRSKFGNKQYVLITLLEAPLLALIIGYFTKYFAGTETNPDQYVFFANDNMVSYLFMSVIVALFLGMIVSAEEIIKDVLILKRESFLHLSRLSYISSKVLIVFIISAFQMLVFVLIGNHMLEIKGMNFKFWLLLFSGACTANLIGLNISSALKSVASIYIIIPLILVPQILFSGTVVTFDKLRSLSKHSKYVPVIGELMTSRWIFEGLVVEQFKNNRFQKEFFEQDRIISSVNFKTTFLFPKMITLLDETQSLLERGENMERAAENLSIIRNEMNDLVRETGQYPGNFQWNLTPASFTPQINEKVKKYINTLSWHYESIAQKANTQKDQNFFKLENKLGGRDQLLNFQSNHTNQSITNLVLNRNQLTKILQINNQLIQRMDPIYQVSDSWWGRSHMFAPAKPMGSYEVDTYWFNFCVIWIMTIVAFLVLYYNWLRKGMNALEAFRIRRLDTIIKTTQSALVSSSKIMKTPKE